MMTVARTPAAARKQHCNSPSRGSWPTVCPTPEGVSGCIVFLCLILLHKSCLFLHTISFSFPSPKRYARMCEKKFSLNFNDSVFFTFHFSLRVLFDSINARGKVKITVKRRGGKKSQK